MLDDTLLMKLSVRGAHTNGVRTACRVVVGNLKERDHLEDPT